MSWVGNTETHIIVKTADTTIADMLQIMEYLSNKCASNALVDIVIETDGWTYLRVKGL